MTSQTGQANTDATARPPAQADAAIADGVDAEIYTGNQRKPAGWLGLITVILCIAYTVFHVGVMNGLHDRFTDLVGLRSVDLTEPWRYRLIHVGGGLALGFLLFSSTLFSDDRPGAADTRRLIA